FVMNAASIQYLSIQQDKIKFSIFCIQNKEKNLHLLIEMSESRHLVSQLNASAGSNAADAVVWPKLVKLLANMTEPNGFEDMLASAIRKALHAQPLVVARSNGLFI